MGSDWSPGHSQDADSGKAGIIMHIVRSLYLNTLQKV